MIKVQDWIPSIPDEEKHIAYVGEGMAETREFLLCGADWEKYRGWAFHLDMAFDPESVTTRDSRQVVQTTMTHSKTATEASINNEEVTTKETFTVHSEDVDAISLTDVAALSRRVTDDGIRLTWTILRQQTQLPGKLWATIRAVGDSVDEVKKSAIMVFEVEPAVQATPAVKPSVSEFQQMEADLDQHYQNAMGAMDAASLSAERALASANGANWYATMAQEAAGQAEQGAKDAQTAAQLAQTAQKQTTEDVVAAESHRVYAAAEAKDACEARQEAQQFATAADEAATTAATAAEAAEACRLYASGAVMKCGQYEQRCSDYAATMATKYATVENLLYNRVNVRDYGAVGDGVADDRGAIIAAFNKAKTMLPCEVYFPAGVYGISNGITVEMEYGTGGLRVCGAGRDITAIKYLDSFTPQSSTQWYAIRIWPVGRPNTAPNTEDEYLHDISITGLTVYDEHPYDHAWNSHKGDAGKEENHGFDIQYCKRVSVTDCKIDSVGDEGIDIFSCHDVVIMNNHLVNTPGAGYGGGAISIGDGSKGVVVSNNTINKTAEDEVLVAGTVLPVGTLLFADTTLADGTTLTAGTTLTEPITLAEDMVLAKSNFGIAVESLFIPVSDVVVTGNTILGVRGSGVHFNTPQTGAKITNLSITDNIISDCTSGIVANGINPKEGLKIHNNMIADCAEYGVELRGGMGDVTIVGNTIRDAYTGVTAVQINSRQLYADNLFENIGECALYVRGKVTVKDCVFNDIGMTTRPTGAICNDVSTSVNGTLTMSGCTMRGIRASNAIYGAQAVYYTDIELINISGMANAGGECFGGSKDCQLKTLIGGNLGGRVKINADNAIVQGVSITSSSIGSNAITINANGVIVTGCNINMSSGFYPAIKEADGKNHNLFANNIFNRGGIVTVGAQSVAVNNIDTRVTA